MEKGEEGGEGESKGWEGNGQGEGKVGRERGEN